jgi:predicted methyltransferase
MPGLPRTNRYQGPLLTAREHQALLAARDAGAATLECSLDLGRSTVAVTPDAGGWIWNGRRYPYPERCKDRTIYWWDGGTFEPAARFSGSLIKLVPTPWGAPTFEIDGIKMLPTEHVSPYADAERKVALVQPRGKAILDTCGGLGYFAACCLARGAARVQSYEKNPDVLWLRNLNPWSPDPDSAEAAAGGFTLTLGDVVEQVRQIPAGSVDAVLHDPPRFGIAGELYSQSFYDQLARVLRPGGKLFHYTGSPNKLTSRRDVPREVISRLQRAGFAAEPSGDGVLATRNRK